MELYMQLAARDSIANKLYLELHILGVEETTSDQALWSALCSSAFEMKVLLYQSMVCLL